MNHSTELKQETTIIGNCNSNIGDNVSSIAKCKSWQDTLFTATS